jgi:multiple sugar transport system permease protein
MAQAVNKSRTTKRNTALALIVPATIILAVINLYPFFYALNLSFHRWNMARPARGYEFVGLANYAAAFSDPRFLNSITRTVIFVVCAVSIEFLLGFGIAFVLNTNLKGMDLIRKIVIVPVMVMPIVASLIWFYMFNQRYGIVNWALGLVGIPPQAWLTSKTLAMPSLIIADVWQWTPFMMLVILAGLRALPEYVYEAAQIDGLSRWQTFRRVTLPLLTPTILIIVLLRIMDAFKLFDLVYTMTTGGPAGSTETLSYYIYIQAFQFFELGYAAALAILMLILIIIISQIFIRWLYKGEAATA